VTAIKTPYLPDGRIDLFCYDSLVEQQIGAGVEGLIVGGTTGEGHLMSWDEHIMLIAHTANRYELASGLQALMSVADATVLSFGSRIAVIGNTVRC
jgi:dihydrodipicolinate synthase/N-acetylneuraminate lyase